MSLHPPALYPTSSATRMRTFSLQTDVSPLPARVEKSAPLFQKLYFLFVVITYQVSRFLHSQIHPFFNTILVKQAAERKFCCLAKTEQPVCRV
jgi:hypothetical protein